jgi:hypothetical protein
MLISLVVLELFPGQDFLKGVIIRKLGKTELCFFCTALFLNDLPTKFDVDISYNFRVISQIKFKK